MKKYLLTLSLFFVLTTTAFAVSDDFNVGVLIGNDTTPPTIPSNVVATPIAAIQIDLTWDASTDDLLLAGYQVYRDAVQIATTTLTTYSDTGLTPSTLYSYNVIAFDSSYNYSTSSAVVATTTLALTPTSTPTTTPTSSGRGPTLELRTFSVLPDIFQATFNWTTSHFAQYELRWGRTESYELGFVVNDIFKKEHQTRITGLEPDTVYEYQLIGRDHVGNVEVLAQDSFRTLTDIDAIAPANVSNLQAQVDGVDTLLTWNNPKDPDFAYVRVVRSPYFYPRDPNDGYIAYEGSGSFLYDEESLADTTIQYYTVFSYDASGNISSGAVVIAYKGDFVPSDETEVPIGSPFDITIDDLTLLQDDEVIRNVNGSFLVDTNKPFVASIPYEVMPRNLKVILVIFNDPLNSERKISFLLRINKDKTAYEAMIEPLRIAGSFPVQVMVYDYSNQLLHVVSGEIISQTTEESGGAEVVSVYDGLYLSQIFNGIFILILFFLLWFIIFKRQQKEEEIV